MGKRTSQDMAINCPHKQLPKGDVIVKCWNCDRYIGKICQETGEKIAEPFGPITKTCPLPNAPGWE